MNFPTIHGLHHFAWRCRDAEETRHFYKDLLGLPLVHLIKADVVPSTGEYCPYVHIFFRMADGSPRGSAGRDALPRRPGHADRAQRRSDRGVRGCALGGCKPV